MSVLNRRTIQAVLELSETPTIKEIRRNYKRLIKKWHPDVNKAPEALEYTKRLNHAYSVCMGKTKLKREYIPKREAPPPRRYRDIEFTWGTGDTKTGGFRIIWRFGRY